MAKDERDREGTDGAQGESEAPEEELQRGRPLSVQDVSPSSPARARPRERTSGDEAAPPSEGEGGEEEGEGARRPTPVRVAMDAPPPGDSRPTESLPARRFLAGEEEEEEWIVRITGRTVSGTPPDTGAPLMELSFYRADEPDVPRRQLLTVERDLELYYDEDLGELLERARPARGDEGGP